jgi:hypothetical protein
MRVPLKLWLALGGLLLSLNSMAGQAPSAELVGLRMIVVGSADEVRSNRAAIGARIKVTVETTGDSNARVTRSIYRTVGSGGSFGANPLEQHIGLGFAARIQSVEIWWPASNTRQTFSAMAPNQFIDQGVRHRLHQARSEAVSSWWGEQSKVAKLQIANC